MTTEKDAPDIFTKAEEEQKREEHLLRNPALRWKSIMSAIDWVEANRPEHLRRNRPRQPCERLMK